MTSIKIVRIWPTAINSKSAFLLAASLLLLFFVWSFKSPNLVEARSGCCSRHGGVCGCGCCDGTSLSATCAPYYPECSVKQVDDVPIIKTNPTPYKPIVDYSPTPSPSPKYIPTPSPSGLVVEPPSPEIIEVSPTTAETTDVEPKDNDSSGSAVVIGLIGAAGLGVWSHIKSKKKVG